MPGMPQFSHLYVNTSQGPTDHKGPWNTGENWQRMDDVLGGIPLDGGDGAASVDLGSSQSEDLANYAARTKSNPGSDPVTGADLGSSGGAEARHSPAE
jgi:Mn-containing catalase